MATQEELEARYKALLVDASDPKYCDKWHLVYASIFEMLLNLQAQIAALKVETQVAKNWACQASQDAIFPPRL